MAVSRSRTSRSARTRRGGRGRGRDGTRSRPTSAALPASSWTAYRDPRAPTHYIALSRADDAEADHRSAPRRAPRRSPAALRPLLAGTSRLTPRARHVERSGPAAAIRATGRPQAPTSAVTAAHPIAHEARYSAAMADPDPSNAQPRDAARRAARVARVAQEPPPAGSSAGRSIPPPVIELIDVALSFGPSACSTA